MQNAENYSESAEFSPELGEFIYKKSVTTI